MTSSTARAAAILLAAACAACTSASPASPGSGEGNDASGGPSPASSSSGGASQDDAGADGPSGDGCAGYVSDADLTTPVVSFSTDVLPIFEHSCGLSSSCHGDRSDIGARGIFLGCDITTSMACSVSPPVAPQVYPNLAGPEAGAPLETTAMPFVTPGDPSQSYLMHKIDGDLCTVTGCVMSNAAVMQAGDEPGTAGQGQPPNWCGTPMPFNLPFIDPSQRDTIRRWIKQGALDN